MISYDFCCAPGAHRFEGWFGSSDDLTRQQSQGLLTCPVCGSADVTRAPSAPNLARKANQRSQPAPTPPQAITPAPAPASPALPPEALAVLHKMALMQAQALKTSTWVGDKFADKARAMHYGETDPVPIHGQATPDEASALAEEGVNIAPILFPIAPPGQTN